jgi:hypothetical protein
MNSKKVKINRAPVLTLWATIVAERLGHDHKTALTLGKAVAGLNAQAKGQRLGIFEKPKEKPLKVERKAVKAKEEMVALLGRLIPMVKTSEGVRAAIKGEVIDPQSVEQYLLQKFGEDLGDVKDGLRGLANSFKPEILTTEAYRLYERFRPSIPEGEKGWGVKGVLDLKLIQSLVK